MSDFNLDLIRSIQPKDLKLNAKSNNLELFYIKDDATAYSARFKSQIADTQVIDCYSLGSLTIGNCEEAFLSIRNTKPKYNKLNGSLMMIDAENHEIEFNVMKALNIKILNEANFYIGISENSFDWLTPLEEIKSGFIYNLEFNGIKAGELISNELSRLPQRNKFYIYKFGSNLNNDIDLNNFVSFFYNIDVVYLLNDSYKELIYFPNNNIKLTSGMKFVYKDIEASFYGIYYKNNIIGYEDISFNQRSEHHFNKAFGSLGLSIKYKF